MTNESKHSMHIITHNGAFHPDDVFSVNLVKQLNPDCIITRTRDEEVIASGDIVIDVGGKHNGTTFFDHHQSDDSLIRADNIPYSSAGLVWNAFGHHYVDFLLGNSNDPDMHMSIYDMIYERFVNPIDYEDNGVSFKDFDISYLKAVQFAFVPSWKHSNDDEFMDSRFIEACNYMEMTIRVEVMRMQKHIDSMDARGFVEQSIKKSSADTQLNRLKILELPQWMPCKKIVADTDLNFIMSPRKENEWTLECIPKEVGSFDQRIPLPEKFAGLKNEELSEATGFKNSVFCHKARFICVLGTREDCIKMAEMSFNDYMGDITQELMEKFGA